MRRLGRPLNPVLARELRQRMRGPRAAIVLTVYLLLLVAVLQLMYAGINRAVGSSSPNPELVVVIGRSVFQTLLFFVLLLVCFIVPGVSAGAIAGERERQTLLPLQITLLSPRSILVGKLLASLAFVSLLVVATLPLVGVSFLLGGVEPLEVVKATVMVLVVAAALAALSIACSTAMRRTQGATVVSYALVLALVLGTFMVFGAQMLASRRGPSGRSMAVLALNPFVAVAGVLEARGEGDTPAGSPFTPLQFLLDQRDPEHEAVQVRERAVGGRGGGDLGEVDDVVVIDDGTDPFAGDEEAGGDRRRRDPLSRVPFWVLSLAAYAGLVAVSLVVGSRRLALPKAGTA